MDSFINTWDWCLAVFKNKRPVRICRRMSGNMLLCESTKQPLLFPWSFLVIIDLEKVLRKTAGRIKGTRNLQGSGDRLKIKKGQYLQDTELKQDACIHRIQKGGL